MSNKTPNKIDVKAGETKALCTCGLSAKGGLCDGAHSREKTGKSPKVVKFDKDQTVYVCSCGRTTKSPNCDGSHSK